MATTKNTFDEARAVFEKQEAPKPAALEEQDQQQVQTQTYSQSGGIKSAKGGDGKASAVGSGKAVDTVADETAVDKNVAAGFDPKANNIVNEWIAKA